MSRDKFEAWWYKKFDGSPLNTDYETWLAGRESMRDEAIKRFNEIGYFGYRESSDVFVEAIQKIEP